MVMSGKVVESFIMLKIIIGEGIFEEVIEKMIVKEIGILGFNNVEVILVKVIIKFFFKSFFMEVKWGFIFIDIVMLLLIVISIIKVVFCYVGIGESFI